MSDSYQPGQLVRSQALRRRAYCKIVINGTDVTDRFDPHLISVTVIDTHNLTDQCNIELDDRDGTLDIPSDSGSVEVSLGWAGAGPRVPPVPTTLVGIDTELGWESSMTIVFQGTVSSVESGFARGGGGGRRLWIDATGSGMYKLGKSMQMDHIGEGSQYDAGVTKGGSQGNISFFQAASQFAANAGMSVNMSSTLAGVMRDYWMIDESFNHWIVRTARELGASVKIIDDKVFISTLTEQVNPVIDAVWGVNLISWRIKPYISRAVFDKAKARWYDSVNHVFREVTRTIGGELMFGGGTMDTINQLPAMAPNRAMADQNTNEIYQDSRYSRGEGWALINGEPMARAGGWLIITGARKGIDATYFISEVEHTYIRNAGYTTRCQLKNTIKAGISTGVPGTIPQTAGEGTGGAGNLPIWM